MDECHIHQHGSRITAWYPAEVKDPIIVHAPGREKVGIIGAVRASDGKLVAMEENKFNAETVQSFLDILIGHRTEGKVMMVIIDNARFHHAKLLDGWLEKNVDNFKLLFLPPYSPELNHIERVWKLLRRQCTHNVYFETLDQLKKTLLAKLKEWANPNSALASLCAV